MNEQSSHHFEIEQHVPPALVEDIARSHNLFSNGKSINHTPVFFVMDSGIAQRVHDTTEFKPNSNDIVQVARPNDGSHRAHVYTLHPYEKGILIWGVGEGGDPSSAVLSAYQDAYVNRIREHEQAWYP